jgi:hypothetical protein
MSRLRSDLLPALRLCALIALPAVLLASALAAAGLFALQWLETGHGPQAASAPKLWASTAVVMAIVAVLPALVLAVWQAWLLWRGRHRASALLAAGCAPGLLAVLLTDGNRLAWTALLLGALHGLLAWAAVRSWQRRSASRG